MMKLNVDLGLKAVMYECALQILSKWKNDGYTNSIPLLSSITKGFIFKTFKPCIEYKSN